MSDSKDTKIENKLNGLNIVQETLVPISNLSKYNSFATELLKGKLYENIKTMNSIFELRDRISSISNSQEIYNEDNYEDSKLKNLVIGNTSQLAYYFPDDYEKICMRRMWLYIRP